MRQRRLHRDGPPRQALSVTLQKGGHFLRYSVLGLGHGYCAGGYYGTDRYPGITWADAGLQV